MTDNDFTFSISRIAFDEDYRPGDGTCATTNFANLARGERRQENLRNTLRRWCQSNANGSPHDAVRALYAIA